MVTEKLDGGISPIIPNAYLSNISSRTIAISIFQKKTKLHEYLVDSLGQYIFAGCEYYIPGVVNLDNRIDLITVNLHLRKSVRWN